MSATDLLPKLIVGFSRYIRHHTLPQQVATKSLLIGANLDTQIHPAIIGNFLLLKFLHLDLYAIYRIFEVRIHF